MKNRVLLKGKSFSILGDSYSTFLGYIPAHYSTYYPNTNAVEDVLCVEDTWWQILVQNTGMILSVNDSYSGSTVCTQVREGHPQWNSFVHRSLTVDFSMEGQSPDYILVFGGTNDSWLEREIGELVYTDPTADQLKQVLPAFCHILTVLSQRYPTTKIVAVLNTDLNPRIWEGMCQAAAHYNVAVVALENIEKQNGHPTATGMAAIAHQVANILSMK